MNFHYTFSESIRDNNDENDNWNADDDNLLIDFKQIGMFFLL